MPQVLGMQSHLLAKILLLKLIRFGQILLDLGKVEAKFEQNRFDLGKIKILHRKKHQISYGSEYK